MAERGAEKRKEKEYLLCIFKELCKKGKISKEEFNKCSDKIINENVSEDC